MAQRHTFLIAIVLMGAGSHPRLATAQISTSTQASSLSSATSLAIHVTAVQGGTQFRPPGQTRWQTLEANGDFAEGVEFRTGPKGAIQFTVGTDQIFRVDRLSTVRVMRAALQSDGTIKTDVGMTYGRVSKDVDVPQVPHDDTIQSPSSTLAVRGTHVSVYDQPPFAPEAVSLTGAAVWRNPRGKSVALGAKGEGQAKLVGTSSSAGQSQIASQVIDPRGPFSGRTSPELIDLQNLQSYGGPDFRRFGVASLHRQSADFLTMTPTQSLFFELNWQGTAFSNLDLNVTTPLGETLSNVNRLTDSGGFKPLPNGIANNTGQGFERVEFPNSFPTGNYTVTVINQTQGAATASVSVVQQRDGKATATQNFKDTLPTLNSSATHRVSVPISSGAASKSE